MQDRSIPLLLKVAHLIRRRHGAVCERFGLTFQQFNVLRILAGAERQGHSGLGIMEISARLIEPGAGITRFVHQLQQLGWIETFRVASDHRRQECRLTLEGRLKIQEVAPSIAREAEIELMGIDAPEEQHLIRLLTKMYTNCQSD